MPTKCNQAYLVNDKPCAFFPSDFLQRKFSKCVVGDFVFLSLTERGWHLAKDLGLLMS